MKYIGPIFLILFATATIYTTKDDAVSFVTKILHPNQKIEQVQEKNTASEIKENTVAEQQDQSNIQKTINTPGPLQKNIDSAEDRTNAVLDTNTLINLTNKARTENGVTVTLTKNSNLSRSAQKKLDDMFSQQYFEHVSPQGISVSNLGSQVGYDYIVIGENLALGNFKSNQDLIDAWMNSPGHRANILRADYKDIGVGVAQGQYDGHLVWVVVQHFGRPRTDCPLIDNSLKSEITAGDKEVASIVTTLENLKKQVEEGRAQGKDMNTEVDSYNEILASYSAKFAALNKLRTTYNDEVRAFNACLSAVQTSLGGH